MKTQLIYLLLVPLIIILGCTSVGNKIQEKNNKFDDEFEELIESKSVDFIISIIRENGPEFQVLKPNKIYLSKNEIIRIESSDTISQVIISGFPCGDEPHYLSSKEGINKLEFEFNTVEFLCQKKKITDSWTLTPFALMIVIHTKLKTFIFRIFTTKESDFCKC